MVESTGCVVEPYKKYPALLDVLLNFLKTEQALSIRREVSSSLNYQNSYDKDKTVSWLFYLNSLAPGKFEWNFRYLIFQIISVIAGWVISCELALRWISLNLTDDKSTLVQVMAWCRQATSHYLSQCWPRSLSPYGVTRPQWVNRETGKNIFLRFLLTEHFFWWNVKFVSHEYLLSDTGVTWCYAIYKLFSSDILCDRVFIYSNIIIFSSNMSEYQTYYR